MPEAPQSEGFRWFGRSHSTLSFNRDEALDDTAEVRFRHSASNEFWGQDVYTARRLFERIVQEVRKRKLVIDNHEDEATTRSNVWRLLGRFEAVWNQSEKSWKNEIDQLLLQVISHHESLDLIRNAMLQSLVQSSAEGGATIEPSAFFQAHGLNAEPLCKRGSLVAAATANLHRELRSRRYQATLDVRMEKADLLAIRVLSSREPLLLDGTSGCGKSWHLQSVGASLSAKGEIVILLDSRGTADATQQHMAKIFSENVWGQDQPLSLERLSFRIKSLLPSVSTWLIVLLDDLRDIDEARRLGRIPWSEFGIKLAITGSPSALNEFRLEAGLADCPDHLRGFTTSELHDYLERCLGENWATVPEHIRSQLRLPILARLYVEIASTDGQSVTNEYQLLDRFWNRLHKGFPLDGVRLVRLVKAIAVGKPYPWSPSLLGDCNVDDACIGRLERVGWLQRTTCDEFEIPHDRLLNWVMAKLLVEALRNKELNPQQLGQRLAVFVQDRERPGGRFFGYTMMDVAWLIASSPDVGVRQSLPDVVGELESAGFVFTEDLYCKLLPTLGDLAESIYEYRLRDLNRPEFFLHQVVQGLVKLSTDVIQRQVERLLSDPNPHVQRVACLILAEHSLPQFLDQLWTMHVSVMNDASKWLKVHEDASLIRRRTFDALLCCSAESPDWIEERIQIADAAHEPVYDLAYLLASLRSEEGNQMWQRAKQTLLDRIPADKLRSLARCMWVYPSSSDINWLLAHSTKTTDFVGPTAFGTLARSFPDIALSAICKLSHRELAITRNWWMPPLARTRPDQLTATMRQLLDTTDCFWEVAHTYKGQESFMSVDILQRLLERMSGDFDSVLESPKDNWHQWSDRLELLAGANTPRQIEQFQRTAGKAFETKLTTLVLKQGPRDSLGRDQASFVRNAGMKVLYKIGGKGYTIVANAMLRCKNMYGRWDGTQFALKRPSKVSVKRCRNIVRIDSRWGEDAPIEQVDAGMVLAAVADWTGLIDLFERVWPKIYDSLTDVLPQLPPPPEAILAPIREQVRKPVDSIKPAHVALLGYSQDSYDITLIRDLLTTCESDSELLLPALVSIRRLSDQSPDSVPVVAKHLRGKHRHLAQWALEENGTLAAKEVLLNDCRAEFDLGVALTLVNDSRTSEQAVALITQHLLDADEFWNRPNILKSLMIYVQDKFVLRCIFSEARIRDIVLADAFCDEGRSWHTGAKATSIEALSVFDTDKAFLAATTALRNPQAHDRQYYPYLLMKIDPTKAFEFLVRLLETETSESVAAAAGRAMSTDLELVRAITNLDENSANGRCARLRAVGWGRRHLPLMPIVEKACEDRNSSVRDAAHFAMNRLWRVFETEALVTALQGAESPANRWILIDALLEVADPGDHHAWPEWCQNIGTQLDPFQWPYLASELAKRQKSCFEKLEKQSN